MYISVSIYLSICLSILLCIYASIHLFIDLPNLFYLKLYLSTHLFIYLQTPSMYLPIHISLILDSRSHATNSGSSSRRKKGKPFKIVAWDKIESADPLATSVFRKIYDLLSLQKRFYDRETIVT